MGSPLIKVDAFDLADTVDLHDNVAAVVDVMKDDPEKSFLIQRGWRKFLRVREMLA